jgi:hypothetical protein
MATPAMAAGAAAAQLPTSEVTPEAETPEGMGMQFIGRGNGLIVVFALIAIGLGIWAASDGGDGDDSPASP